MSLKNFVQALPDVLKTLKDAARNAVSMVILGAKHSHMLPSNNLTLLLKPDGWWGDDADFRGDEAPLGKIHVRLETYDQTINLSSIGLEKALQRKGFLKAMLEEIANHAHELTAGGKFTRVIIQNIVNDGVRDFVASRVGWGPVSDKDDERTYQYVLAKAPSASGSAPAPASASD